MNIERLPKIELHCHLDGCVRVETMYELLKEQGDIENIELEDFRNLASIMGECNSLIEYLERFKYPGKVMQTKENLERITYEVLEDMHRENVVYAELRFAPYLHMEKGLSFDEIMESVIKGMERARESFDIIGNLILIAMRHEDEENSINVAKQGEKYLGKGVVGFDIAGNEADFPPKIHEKAFRFAKEAGYKITIHAGETGVVSNIYDAIELGADRIGHGIAAIKDKLLMEKLADEKIALEMCPISNMQTKSVENMKDYPIKTFLDKDIEVTINTDNRTVSNTSLTKEIEFCMKEFDLNETDILKVLENSANASFANEDDKNKIKNIIRNI